MGITTWQDRSRYGLSLTLGGGETKLLDLAQVYSVVANMGIKNKIQDITEIKNYQNKVLYKSSEILGSKEKILDPELHFY